MTLRVDSFDGKNPLIKPDNPPSDDNPPIPFISFGESSYGIKTGKDFYEYYINCSPEERQALNDKEKAAKQKREHDKTVKWLAEHKGVTIGNKEIAEVVAMPALGFYGCTRYDHDKFSHSEGTATIGWEPCSGGDDTIDDPADVVVSILGTDGDSDSEWEGQDNITGDLSVINDFDHVAINLLFEVVDNVNKKITGNVSVTQNDGNPHGAIIKDVNGYITPVKITEPDKIYEGCTATSGVAIEDPMNPGHTYLYIPNNDKTAILVFEYHDGKQVKKPSWSPGKRDIIESKKREGIAEPSGVPDNCNLCIMRHKNLDDKPLLIWKRSATDQQFFSRDARIIMHNKKE